MESPFRPKSVQRMVCGSGHIVYIYRWDRQGRKGQRCKLLARGTMNSCLLEFDDGYQMVTSRNALRKALPKPPNQ